LVACRQPEGFAASRHYWSWLVAGGYQREAHAMLLACRSAQVKKKFRPCGAVVSPSPIAVVVSLLTNRRWCPDVLHSLSPGALIGQSGVAAHRSHCHILSMHV
jgi:hypothetical protein